VIAGPVSEKPAQDDEIRVASPSSPHSRPVCTHSRARATAPAGVGVERAPECRPGRCLAAGPALGGWLPDEPPKGGKTRRRSPASFVPSD
jgi:hypothetical protein